MTQLAFGTKNQIRFQNEHDFFYTLGFLANGRRSEFAWEHNENQGAWGSEGRIHCLAEPNLWPQALQNAFTAGRPGIIYRINCNEYVNYLRTNYAIQLGKVQNATIIRNNVPVAILPSFDGGFNI